MDKADKIVLITGATGRQGGAVAVYLAAADKYRRLTHRLSQEQKGLDERALMVSPWPSHLW